VKPVYGQGFFFIGLDGRIWYTIIFDYHDPERYYYELLLKGGKRLSDEEAELRSNMQRLMDEEKVSINGERVRPVVERAFVEVRGSPQRPTIVFIVRMDYKPIYGRNVYEDFYEKTRAEYDYTVTWGAPPCGFFESYEGPGSFKIEDNILRLKVRSGTRISGYESVVFNLSNCGTPKPRSS